MSSQNTTHSPIKDACDYSHLDFQDSARLETTLVFATVQFICENTDGLPVKITPELQAEWTCCRATAIRQFVKPHFKTCVRHKYMRIWFKFNGAIIRSHHIFRESAAKWTQAVHLASQESAWNITWHPKSLFGGDIVLINRPRQPVEQSFHREFPPTPKTPTPIRANNDNMIRYEGDSSDEDPSQDVPIRSMRVAYRTPPTTSLSPLTPRTVPFSRWRPINVSQPTSYPKPTPSAPSTPYTVPVSEVFCRPASRLVHFTRSAALIEVHNTMTLADLRAAIAPHRFDFCSEFGSKGSTTSSRGEGGGGGAQVADPWEMMHIFAVKGEPILPGAASTYLTTDLYVRLVLGAEVKPERLLVWIGEMDMKVRKGIEAWGEGRSNATTG